MRHGTKINALGRKSAHRKAMLSNMASQLIQYKRISTSVAKAKALKRYVEPLLTRSKTDSTHSRRVVFSYLQNKYAIQELFGEVSAKIGDRPGGYTRILRTGTRLGDNAEMCVIELVDFNDSYTQAKEKKTGKKKRSRRGGAKTKSESVVDQVKDTANDTAETVTEPIAEAAEVVKEETAEVVEEVKEEVAEVKEETKEAVAEVKKEVAEKKEEAKEKAKEETKVETPKEGKKDDEGKA